ncbi:NAD(P)-dependent dehydrogenase, short-chain alcohol dehydrogenase family [Thalassobacillus cyri]|uniref:NAD(P)-dependent dehydrogenase, short-chain alcohol dehydrogenase family n=1 Tax=Thalassobacillus cyri TaxID=571932 RepID=A0A1H3Y2A5_9BACI|nr:SDR family oxidoreductase [Thalassobacillus cyri]SEA05857.1 NAD(P)-dependent dehydrogenase, short-chain alcohol dehydrogenase family [Thalassobacillus cyri]
MKPTDRQTEGQPKQVQDRQPGFREPMEPKPIVEDDDYKGSGKLKDKVALITGGDSGIGRAVAIGYAKEGAHLAIVYLDEHEDAESLKERVEQEGVKCLLIAGDAGEEQFAKDAVQQTVDEFGKLNILVNNVAEQHPQASLEEISTEQMERTFKTNFYSYWHFTRAAVPHLKEGDAIINTTSINAYRGNKELIDYTATKGAVVGFTRSMAQVLVDKGIRVNMVAPGPIWTPLIPSSFDKDKVEVFGTNTPMDRPGQPVEHVGSYVLLASDDSSYMTGQCIHINGGHWMSS